MSQEYLRDFQTLIDQMKQHSSFEIIADEIVANYEEGLAELSVNELRMSFGFNLTQNFEKYIDVSLHTHLRFVYYINGDVSGGGEFHLSPIADSLTSTQDPELWHEGMTQQEIEFLKYFRVFDDHPDSGDFKLAAFHLTPGVSPPAFPDIYFYDRGEYWKMNLDYGGYLDGLLGLLGVSNWQYLFCDVDMTQPKYESLFNELNNTLNQLTKLFPARDFETYREILRTKRESDSRRIG
ncbi:MAG: hypothetical protein F6K37_34645 [Moorea sp. SIO4E2]|uniref:hypothetical protein n=1 Tax=Moorena sp. SIO4E2 TaxID=2607826 RepID=UPI0013B76C72|nr:hypothetical protein [Moorena sp. SIO4E2]NEQ10872.1 hypothetical protein [Moorena sp. SIO4E2]